jgi:hypothetical protein
MLTTIPPPTGILSGPAHYLHWGVIQISMTNFLVIVAMIVVFVLALIVPFPSGDTKREVSRHGRQ